MDNARWDLIQDIFHHALELPEAECESYIAAQCGDDSQLKIEILEMLRADKDSASILDRGLPEIAYRMVGRGMEPIPSGEIGPYRLVRVLGEGGMGVVWLAARVDAGNHVAIKFLLHAALSPARRERFAQEIRTLAKLRHRFIARLYDAGTLADGTPWFAMEYVEGVRFSEYCGQQRRTVDTLLRLFRSVCEAVQYAHGQEVIHRDLKPSNILVEADGTPRLLDFGIARELQQLGDSAELTRPGLRFMSPDYAAPEWTRDGVVGFYTDVYSLGVILYEMLTGRLPFKRSNSTPDQPEASIAEGQPVKPSVAAARNAIENDNGLTSNLPKASWKDLDVLCLKAMHRDPKERYTSVEALIRDIDRYLNCEPLEARSDGILYRTDKFIRRHRTAVLATAAVFVLVVSMSILFAVRLAKARNAALAEAVRRERIQQFMLNLIQGGDKDAGPAEDLRVVTLVDRGVSEGRNLNGEPDVQADLYQTLGEMYQKLGRLEQAGTLLQSSLKERQSLPEPNGNSVADNSIVLGLLRSDQGQSKEAERLVRQALGMIKTNDRSNESILVKGTSALGYVLNDEGKYKEAADVLRQAVNLQSTGPYSAELAKTLSLLADSQIYLGNYDDADVLNQRALAIDRQVYGDTHPNVSDDLENLSQTQEMRGHYAEAEQYERQALQVTQAWYGKNHPDTARKMAHLAGTLIYEGKYDEANSLLQQSLVIVQRVYGDISPHVAYVLNLVGSVANKRRDFKSAETDYLRMAAIYRTALGDSDYKVGVALANLAGVYQNEKRYSLAEQTFGDALKIYSKVLSADNINIGISEIKLGRLLLHEHRYREAEGHSRAGYEIVVKQMSPSAGFVKGAREDLAAIYEALKEPQAAKRFRDEFESSNVATSNGQAPK